MWLHGEQVIRDNKFAVATMAGGQGTRLGTAAPKGTYRIDVEPEGKYLFEIISDTLKDANEKYGVVIPWYIMTSKENNKKTVEFLSEQDYFGYPKEDVRIFEQEEIPLLDKQGKLIIDEDMKIKQAANGNGGIFSSMSKRGILDDMRARGIEWVFIGSVDNVLLKMVDTFLIGATVFKKTEIGTKTILKKEPNEKVGVFCRKKGKIKVIEYTEIPEELSSEYNERGELVFGDAHIMCNLFHISALEKASTKELLYHIVEKESKYVDSFGQVVNPAGPNCYKFEKFIFDAFGLFDDITVVRGKREEDFAPVKNMTGEDSLETAKILYDNYWAGRLIKK